ncbi:putative nuclease HARBI1 [Pocillopora verrucosa]|uniref:putative nuclease HARBI1 n=1 Tax=Pocillopora verrucosa TaxID=203993 RepID=UPI003341E139
MKHLRDTADDDDKRRLSRIVTEVCASITSRLNVFLAETSDSGGRAAWKIPRIQNVLEHEFLHFPDRKWLESYRISKDMFEQLTHDLRSLQRQVTRLRSPVPVRTVVAMLLKRLGKGLDYREIGDKFGVGASTACIKVNEAMKLLVSSKMHIISKIQRGIDFKRIINGFQRKWNFPQCLGAIDGTHIPIKAPLVHHADFYNRKCFHSVILQGVCDSQCCFTNVFAGWPGRAHDSRVFGRSQIGNLITEGRLISDDSNLRRVIDNHVIEPFLIGDPAYPISKHLMKNYPGSNLTPEKEHFNYRLSRARIQIERAFGRLKGRWRCLLKALECELDKVVLHATTACILHNICEERKECYLEEWNRLGEDEIGDLPRPDPLNDDDADSNSNIIRNILAHFLYND